MRRTSIVILCWILLSIMPGALLARINPAPPTQRSSPADATRLSIAKAHGLAGREAWAAAEAEFAKAIDSPGFADLNDAEQYTALSQAARLSVAHGDTATAHRWLSRSSAYARAADMDWHLRLRAAFDLADYVDSGRCIATIARRWPDTLDQLNERAIFRVAAMLDKNPAQEADRRELLDSLFDARWTDDGVAPDGLWLDLVRLQLKQGKADKAAVVARRIAAPRSVLALLVDRRYDALTNQEGFERDIDQVAATALRRAEARARAAPERLQPRVAVQVLLLEDRQFERVLASSDEVIARVGGDGGGSAYADFDEEYPWILDSRARALRGLERWDEALAQLRKAARRPEHGGLNVSQSLNLGMLYAELDRPADALEMIEELGSMSDYGRMVRESIALIVAVTNGDAAAIAEHLDYLRDHRDDAIGQYQDALLAADRIDAAADLMIERLRSERWRSDALLSVQDYAPVPMTPLARRNKDRLSRIMAMPRVRAELDKIGRIEHLKLGPPLD